MPGDHTPQAVSVTIQPIAAWSAATRWTAERAPGRRPAIGTAGRPSAQPRWPRKGAPWRPDRGRAQSRGQHRSV